jgi:hypothetical protein
MVKIKFISNIHTEYWLNCPLNNILKNEIFTKNQCDILVLNGNIGTMLNLKVYYDKFKSFIRGLCTEYRYVLFIPGQFEFYSYKKALSLKQCKELIVDIFKEINEELESMVFPCSPNAILLQNETFTFYEYDKPINIIGRVFLNENETDKLLLKYPDEFNDIYEDTFVHDIDKPCILITPGKLSFEKCLELSEKNILGYLHGSPDNYEKDDIEYINYKICSTYNPVVLAGNMPKINPIILKFN